MPYSKTLNRLVEQDHRYESYDFLGDDEESKHQLWLAQGWKASSDPIGVVHFGSGRTVKECLEDSEPIPCDCEDCKTMICKGCYKSPCECLPD